MSTSFPTPLPGLQGFPSFPGFPPPAFPGTQGQLPPVFPGIQGFPPPSFPFPPPPSFRDFQKGVTVIKEDEVLRPPEECDPNETIYVNNLNDRIKERIMKAYLEKRFGPCHLVVMSSLRRRGQAWIVYRDIEAASRALTELQGQLAFGKKMRISFSRNISDLTREKRGMMPRTKTDPRDGSALEIAKAERPISKSTTDNFFQTSVAAPKASTVGYNPPNRILFVENLSEETSCEVLSKLFGPFEGFMEARIIPSRGVAFIEFQDEYSSQIPLGKLQNFEIEPGRYISISNARK